MSIEVLLQLGCLSTSEVKWKRVTNHRNMKLSRSPTLVHRKMLGVKNARVTHHKEFLPIRTWSLFRLISKHIAMYEHKSESNLMLTRLEHPKILNSFAGK